MMASNPKPAKSTAPNGVDPFSVLPAKLKKELVSAFGEIVNNFAESRWEPAELNGGKLCEVVYSILLGYVNGKYPDSASKPQNMVDACNAFAKIPKTDAPRTVRIQIPRMLIALYEVRNNRNVGHVGGDVDPSHMDALCVLEMAKWTMAELVRLLHQLSTDEATEIVEKLITRRIQVIWEIGDTKRVLRPELSAKAQTLLLLHSSEKPLTSESLVSFIEYSNPSVYRSKVLGPCHKERLVEFNKDTDEVTISPIGIAAAEKILRSI